MIATDILMEEHRVIERVLNTLEKAALAANKGEKVNPEFFIEAADFIKGFADGCHHKKEEGVLFKEMVNAGVPEQGGPVGVMLNEHEQGRVYTNSMRQAAEQWQAGDEAGRKGAVQNALGYVNLLRVHIHKEENILFPLAGRVIPVDRQEPLTDAFEHIEHEETGEGVHEKYLGMAERLEKEAAGF